MYKKYIYKNRTCFEKPVKLFFSFNVLRQGGAIIFTFNAKKNIKHDFVDVCNNPESHAANDSNKQYVAKETDTYSIIAYCSI